MYKPQSASLVPKCRWSRTSKFLWVNITNVLSYTNHIAATAQKAHLYNTSEDQEGAACFNISHRCIIETICLCASQLRRGLLCPRPQKITKSCNHNTVHRTKQPPSPPLSTPCTLRVASGKQPTLSRTIFTPVIPFSFLSSSRDKDTKASKHQNQEQLLLHCSQTTEQSTYKLWPPISQTTSWNLGTFVACTFSVTVTLYSALFHFSLHFLFDLYFGTRGNNKQIQVSKIMYELLIWNLHRKTSCFVPRSQ